MYLYIPHNLNFIVLKNEIKKGGYILIYNQKNYLIFNIQNIRVLKYSSFIKLNNNVGASNKLNILEKHLHSYNNFYTKKINFKGKGYKITKKKTFLILNFNHSHITFVLLFNTICIKLNKNKYLMVLKNLLKIDSLALKFVNIKHLNIYTHRGIKLSKQKIYKKIGKRT